MVVYFRICFIYKSFVSKVYLDLAILVAYFITLLGKVLFSKYMEEAQDILKVSNKDEGITINCAYASSERYF